MVLIFDSKTKGNCCICGQYWEANATDDNNNIYCPSCAMWEVINKRAKFHYPVETVRPVKTNVITELLNQPKLNVNRVKKPKANNDYNPSIQLNLFT